MGAATKEQQRFGGVACGHPALSGLVSGSVDLPVVVKAGAAALAEAHFAKCEAEEFSGDSVEDYEFPDWLADRWAWFPHDAVAQLGFEPDRSGCEALYATVAAPEHVDDICGPNFILCLFNDGLLFRMSGVQHETGQGEWFLFDDRIAHEVLESDASSTYVVWSVPLKPR